GHRSDASSAPGADLAIVEPGPLRRIVDRRGKGGRGEDAACTEQWQPTGELHAGPFCRRLSDVKGRSRRRGGAVASLCWPRCASTTLSPNTSPGSPKATRL